ncbi:VOC family protein [Salinibacterium sp. ZJ450]|uniref:VOC family protein n=1 Tax=Salinibacterium sp. ZJ450 TaxID=2708338 RepID=UPI001CD37C65|nr:VOC family protein [Salinibacterium sp. ZJ450]
MPRGARRLRRDSECQRRVPRRSQLLPALPAGGRGIEYRGSTVSYSADVAFYDSGNIRVELIQPTGDGPSPYHDHLAAHGGQASVHHVAYLVDSIDEHVARATERGSSPRLVVGAPLPAGNGRYAYYEGLMDGIVVEFIERHP